jgi:hypothetical protein
MRKIPNGCKGLNASLDEKMALMQHSKTASGQKATFADERRKRSFDLVLK